MSARIRKNGRIYCAALRPERKYDMYINDGLHYYLSVEMKVLVTEPWQKHQENAEWWWINQVPEGVEIDEFYKNP